MDLEDWRGKWGGVLSSHGLRSVWSGIKAQQNGMKAVISSTVRYWNSEGRACQDWVKFKQPCVWRQRPPEQTEALVCGWTVYIKVWPYPGRVWLVELVEHDHCCTAVVKNQPPKIRCGPRQGVRSHDKGSLPVEAVSESRIDVIVTLPFCGNQEGKGAIRRQDIHAAVFLSVSGQQRNAAFFHVQVGSHRVERLQMETLTRYVEDKSKFKGAFERCESWVRHIKGTKDFKGDKKRVNKQDDIQLYQLTVSLIL